MGWVVTYHDEGVVEQEHDSGRPPGPSLAPEEHLANVTHILDLRVAKTEFPGGSVSTQRHLQRRHDSTRTKQ